MKTVDLFAGCGGMSLGFQEAGFNLVAAFDIWEKAIQTYQENFDHPIFKQDLSAVDAYERVSHFQPEMIIGGPPCQDFSSAGKRDESLGRANLTLSFAHIVVKLKPQWFVMENVARISKSQILKIAYNQFKKVGYGLTSCILDASYCSVPQTRKRYFLIGHLQGKDDALKPILQKNKSEKPMTVFDYLGESLGIECFYRHPRSYKRRGVFSIYEPSPTIRGVNRPVPKTYQKHPGDAGDIDQHLRALTTLERSYLQTFPKTFKFQGNKSELEQMIGNAVPVKLAEYVALCIREYLVTGDRLTQNNVNKGSITMGIY
jgi:DNA (cytosine-5)-methyltransferase 1